MDAPPSKPLTSLRVAVVGYGSIGRRHCDNLGRLGVTRRIVVRRPNGANPAFVPPIDAAVVHSSQAALDTGLDLAIVCNPTSQHVETALEFVAEGVGVLVEKPISNDLRNAELLATETLRRRVWAAMAYSLRYHPAYRLAREALLAGRIGRVAYAKAWFEGYLPAWHPWEDYRDSYAARRDLGGGALPTLDHDLDFMNWCLGRPLTSVGLSANSGTLATDADDVALVTARYPSGVIANAVFSLCRREASRGFELIGSQATLRMEFESARLQLLLGSDQHAEVLWHRADYDLNEMYLEMLRDVLAAFAAGLPPPVPLQAGVDALRVAIGHCEKP
ncbi:MAG TPA: Gfo/Idh/MocA family oxidoreductase [Pirellulales bacterium]|jgi:predicted dehydrogenase|nr:Gfo/Idh/MocA family oxidoreductase [Pirellulales bacterium]